METTIEVRGFLGLAKVFAERGWKTPHRFAIANELTGSELVKALGLREEEVECLFVNRKACAVEQAVVKPGDRVAVVPPGTPGPHRFLLGMKKKS